MPLGHLADVSIMSTYCSRLVDYPMKPDQRCPWRYSLQCTSQPQSQCPDNLTRNRLPHRMAALNGDTGAVLAPFHKRGYTAEPIDEGLMGVEKELRPARDGAGRII